MKHLRIVLVLMLLTLWPNTFIQYNPQATAAIIDGVAGIAASNSGSTFITYRNPVNNDNRIVEVSLSTHEDNNGRGIAYDGNELWFTVLDVKLDRFGIERRYSDGKIYHMPLSNLNPNQPITDPASINDPFGPGIVGAYQGLGGGIGAMDFYQGNLWVISSFAFGFDTPSGFYHKIYKINPTGGGVVLASCKVHNDPNALSLDKASADSLAIVNNKILTTAGSFARTIKEYDLPSDLGDTWCTQTNEYLPADYHTGIDSDRDGNLLGGNFNRLTNMGNSPYINIGVEVPHDFFRLGSFTCCVTDITTTFVQPVPPPPSLSTTIKDHITNEDLTGKIIRFNRTVHDTVTITGSSGAPSGKITYTLYNNINCGIDPDSPSSSIIRRDEVDIDPNSGFIPPSSPFVLDSSGSVSYQAYYNSDNANYRSTLSPCEPLTFSSLSTSIMDDMTGDRYPSVIMPFGRVVHDTATIDTGGSRMALGIPEPTGNIVFQRYNSTNCTGDFIGESGSGVSPGGSVFPILRSSSINLTYSPTVSYKAFYSGDRNYDSLVSLCESIRVLPPQITTTIKDQKNMTINVGSTVPIGTIIHDTAQIFGITGTPPGTIAKGTVTYQRFFHSDPFTDPHSFCNGDHIDEPPVTINSTGGIPNSADFTLTAPGIVSYKAVYDGWGASSACEYIRVNPSP